MSEFTEDGMVELAFNVVNSRELSKDERLLLKEIQASTETQAVFNDCLRTLRETRLAFDEVDAEPREVTAAIDDNTLAEYLDGVLSDAEREQVETRLVREPGALGQLMSLVDLIHVDRTKDAAVTYVIELAKTGLRLLSHPEEGFERVALQPAATLGPDKSASVKVWIQDLGPLRVQCTLQRAKDDLLGLTIKLIAPDPPPRGTRISLKSHGKLVQSDVLKEGGEVVLRDLEPITYDLEIIVPATNVASMRFDFINRDPEKN